MAKGWEWSQVRFDNQQALPAVLLATGPGCSSVLTAGKVRAAAPSSELVSGVA